jgi:cell division protein FtsQ
MSREGRSRLRGRLLRGAGALAALGAVAWAAVEVSGALDGAAAAAPASDSPVRQVRLATDGVLDKAWIAHTLALPANASLAGLDLAGLRSRVMADRQVRDASLTREFPGTLAVKLSERVPVARVMAQDDGKPPRAMLVAADGVVFGGACYAAAYLEALPWLDGVRLAREGGGFAAIGGMGAVADLLSRARAAIGPLERTWRVVSLARLDSDGEIAVRTGDGLTVTFSAQEDLFRQFAKLDLLMDVTRAHPDQNVRSIDLALGGQVPVAVGTPAAGQPAAGGAAPSGSAARGGSFTAPRIEAHL